MQECTKIITHAVGLHARPAAQFVKLAKGFSSTITITNTTRNSEKSIDAKSLIALIKIACAEGHSIRITAEGDDEQEAINALANFVQAGDQERK